MEFIITIAAAVITAPIGIKLLDYLISAIKAYLAKRKENRLQLSQSEIERRRLDQIAQVDVSKIKRDDFQTLIDVAIKMAKESSQRADIAEKERDDEKSLREKCESSLKNEISSLKADVGKLTGEHKSCHIVLDQIERNQRILFDSMNVAYWEVDSQGKCTINQTFLRITGMNPGECANDGWLEAVDEADRNKITYKWKSFRENFQTHTLMSFNFKHRENGALTKVVAECSVIMLNGLEVHKYTARTKPLDLAFE